MNIREILQRCFQDPARCLGGIEKNVEVKIVFLTLVELGWDPATNLALDFQIPKEKFPDRVLASLAIDLVARDDAGICIAGEVKAYHRKLDLQAHIPQIIRYRDALEAPLAFLTNGKRWMLFKEGAKAPFMDRTFVSVDEMVVVLKSQMGPGIVKGKSMQVDWQMGIGYRYKKRRSPLRDILRFSVGGSGSSDLMAIRNRVLDEIDRLAEAYPGRVYCDHKKNAAQLKRVGSTEAFLEVRFGPHDVSKYPKGYIVRRDRALRSLAVPVDVKKRFAAYCGRELGDTQGFIRAAEQLIGYF